MQTGGRDRLAILFTPKTSFYKTLGQIYNFDVTDPKMVLNHLLTSH